MCINKNAIKVTDGQEVLDNWKVEFGSLYKTGVILGEFDVKLHNECLQRKTNGKWARCKRICIVNAMITSEELDTILQKVKQKKSVVLMRFQMKF